jgi:hypothetical protein
MSAAAEFLSCELPTEMARRQLRVTIVTPHLTQGVKACQRNRMAVDAFISGGGT